MCFKLKSLIGEIAAKFNWLSSVYAGFYNSSTLVYVILIIISGSPNVCGRPVVWKEREQSNTTGQWSKQPTYSGNSSTLDCALTYYHDQINQQALAFSQVPSGIVAKTFCL